MKPLACAFMKHFNLTSEILDLAEARRRVEEIKPLIKELMELSCKLRALHVTWEQLPTGSSARDELERRIQATQEGWRQILQQINDRGGYVKDPERGLLDFYAWREEELVFLCYQYGEATIQTWHGLFEGYSGRKPVESDP